VGLTGKKDIIKQAVIKKMKITIYNKLFTYPPYFFLAISIAALRSFLHQYLTPARSDYPAYRTFPETDQAPFLTTNALPCANTCVSPMPRAPRAMREAPNTPAPIPIAAAPACPLNANTCEL
jgi:hypothetical protein